METLAEKKHGTGGIVDSYDSRDFKLKEVAGMSTPFDWKEGYNVEDVLGFKLKVKDQGNSSSCGGQAWSSLAEILEAISTKSYEPRSAKYIYAQTAVQGGGSYGRDNCDVLSSQGIANEDLLPSYPATEEFLTKAIDITPSVRENAKKTVLRPYAHADFDIDSIAQAIRDHYGVVLGVDGENNGSWTSKYPKPPKKTKWRHWVCAVGAEMIKGKKYIKIINSWGDKIGEKGYQWLSEDYFTSGHIFDNWTHVFYVKPEIAPFLVDMAMGQTSDEIKRLQAFLAQLGYFQGEATGFYGDKSRKAVYAFQEKYVKMSYYEDFILRGSKCGSKTRLAINNLIK